MKKIRLVVEKREQTGSGPCGRLRKNGIIPAVIYGRSGVKNLQIAVPDFRQMMLARGDSAALIELVCGNESFLAMLKMTQRNPRTDNYEHIDFKEVAAHEKLQAVLPIHFVGEADGVKNSNGTMEVLHYSINVECLPENLPENIEVDVSSLQVGHSLHVKDLPVLKGVTYKSPTDTVIVSCVKEVEEAEEESEESSEAEAEKTEAPQEENAK